MLVNHPAVAAVLLDAAGRRPLDFGLFVICIDVIYNVREYSKKEERVTCLV
jgi:hypothetical protein